MTESPSPSITTFILTYKRPQLLERAIKSVLDQTYANFRVCILDNASGDETSEVVSRLAAKDSRIEYICHPENIGMMANYQYAFGHVETPYFSLLSDDDLLLPCFYETALEGFQKCSQAGFSAGSSIVMTQKGVVRTVPLDYWPREGVYQVPEGLRSIIGQGPVPTTVLFNREVINVVGDLDVENALVWDCDFVIRVAALFPIVISKQPCGLFLAHEGSCSTTAGARAWCAGFIRLFERFMNNKAIASEVKEIAEPLFVNFLQTHTYSCGKYAIGQKMYADVREVATVLRVRYGLHTKAALLQLASRICQIVPFSHSLFIFLRACYRKVKYRQLQKQYGDLVHKM